MFRAIEYERRHSRTKDLTGLPHPHRASLHNRACIGMDKDLVSHSFHPISKSCPAIGSGYAFMNDALDYNADKIIMMDRISSLFLLLYDSL